ncbi:MAG: ABC transporter permease [Elusimicrobiota bacterium]
MKMLQFYLHVWFRLVMNSFKTQMATPLGSVGYLIGKLLRIGFFLGYLTALFGKVPILNGYGAPEIVLFFMTFNLIDVGGQFLFRGIYGIKSLIEEGDFDKYLTQPVHLLFRISVMGTDFLDLLTLVPIFFFIGWAFVRLPGPIDPINIIAYVLLLMNAIIISYAFHVMVGALSVKTQEVESAIWIYRDVMSLGRFPVSIYNDFMRIVFITVVPIGVMVSFPAQALLKKMTLPLMIYAFILGLSVHFLAQMIWRRTLKSYSSNSG